jgi:SAM-dependent methyltransferase
VSGEPVGFSAIEQLEDDALRIAVVRTALELDLFTALADRPCTAAEVAHPKGVSERGVTVVLDALCAMGLLDKPDGAYALTQLSSHYLARNNAGYYGKTLLDITLSLTNAASLTEAVRHGVSQVRSSDAENAGQKWAADFAPSLVSWRGQAADARQAWDASGVDLTVPGGLRVLDIGCGSGVKTLVAAQANPHTSVTGFDRYPEVLDVASEVADLMGVAERFTPLCGDLRDADFGEGGYDVIYSSAVLYFFAENSGLADVFSRVHAALAPGGRFVLNHRMPDPHRRERVEPLLLAVQLFILHENSHVATAREYTELLTQAGFPAVEERRWDMLVATRD